MFECRVSLRFQLSLNCCLLFYALVVVGIHSDAQGLTPRYAVVQCPDRIRDSAGEMLPAVICGRALLPENRGTLEGGGQVELFVLRILPDIDAEHAPLLHLAGGPGDASSADLAFWLESSIADDYEVILVDQRGTGLSLPSLDCPEESEADDERWIRECRRRLIEQGIDLSQYQSMPIVWDIHDLLVALELDQINLYGNSYGSRLALLLSTIAPERIRSMTLDGVYPPPRYDLAELAYNADQSLERLFEDCRADAACQLLLPDLRETFYRVVAEMNAEPAELTHLGESAGWTLSGDQFLAWTIGVLRHKEALPILPALIEMFDAGVYDLFVLIDGFVKAPHWHDLDFRSEGVELGIRCSESQTLAGLERAEDFEREVAEEITSLLDPLVQDLLDQCEIWDASPAPLLIAQPVASDVPALLLSGAYDPATPPHWADFAATHLSASWNFVFPNLGHGVLEAEECAARIMRAFLDSPMEKPAAECFFELGPPQFVEQEMDES